MFNEFLLLELDADRRKLFLEKAAKARLLKSIKQRKPGLKCILCEKLAKILLEKAEQLRALAEERSAVDLPSLKSEDLRKLLENQQADSFFI